MHHSERVTPQTPLKSQTPYTVRPVSGRPESTANLYTYTDPRICPLAFPFTQLSSFLNEREVRFSKHNLFHQGSQDDRAFGKGHHTPLVPLIDERAGCYSDLVDLQPRWTLRYPRRIAPRTAKDLIRVLYTIIFTS
jgi:hypothetical protein